MRLQRHVDVYKWDGFWRVEVRTSHAGWTDTYSTSFKRHADALRLAVRMVGL